jgi:hypothetical protein
MDNSLSLKFVTEMKQPLLIVSAVAVGVTAFTALIYFNFETVEEIFENVAYDSSKVEVLSKLRRIRRAKKMFLEDLASLEAKCAEHQCLGTTIDVVSKNTICALSVNLDFIFDSLDRLECDQSIRSERKKIIDELSTCTDRVDNLVKLIK